MKISFDRPFGFSTSGDVFDVKLDIFATTISLKWRKVEVELSVIDVHW